MTIPGTFFGLNIGLSGLEAAQAAQTVTGNNIANGGTAGYTEESAVIVQGPADGTTGSSYNGASTGLYGSGAMVNSIARSRSQFLDAEYRNAQSTSSGDSAMSGALSNVQGAFNEPSTTGISSAITTFFTSVSNLENTPSDVGIRTTVIDSAASLAQTINTVQGNLTTTGQGVTTNINEDMTQVNTIGQQIAGLNVQIQQDVAQNIQPNTLLDQRDLLVDNLSKLVNVTATTAPNGGMNVAIGSTDLVVGTTASTVSLTTMQSRGDLTSGEVYGLNQAQTAISGYQSNLNTLAATIVSSVNSVQTTGAGLDGSTNIPFFTATTGSEASTIAVNPTLQNNPSQLAAGSLSSIVPPATTPPASDASNLVLLENVSTTNQSALSNQTISGFFTTMISGLGATTSDAQTNATNAAASTTQLSNQRATVEGVSTDNEMTNMMIYQRSYQASAQFISIQDNMLNTLVNSIFGTT
jgi:flagellar hook-associated protein 1 FlgK